MSQEQYTVATGVTEGIRWFVSPGLASYNGYVRLPADHPFLDFHDYYDIPVDVHGGITWKVGNIIGFDTMHAGDSPNVEVLLGDNAALLSDLMKKEMTAILEKGDAKVWTVDDVSAEARHLAQQVAKAAR